MGLPITPEQDATIKARLGMSLPNAGQDDPARPSFYAGPVLESVLAQKAANEALKLVPGSPGGDRLLGRDITTHAPREFDQAAINERFMGADELNALNREQASRHSTAAAPTAANEWVARAIYADAAKRADDEERARLRQAAAMLVAKREADGPFASVAAGAGSLARAFGGTDTYQAAMDRDRLLDVQSAQNAVTLGNIAKALGESGRGAAQHARDAELEKLKAYIAAMDAANWALPIAGGPRSSTDFSRDVTGGFVPPTDAAATAAAPAGTAEPVQPGVGAAPHGTPREQLLNYFKTLRNTPSPAAPITPGGVDRVVSDEPAAPVAGVSPEQVKAAEVALGAKGWPAYPKTYNTTQTYAGQKAYLEGDMAARDKALAQMAEAAKSSGVTTQEKWRHDAPSGAHYDFNKIREAGQMAHGLSALEAQQYEGEANRGSREQIATDKQDGGGGVKPETVALTPSGRPEKFKDSKTASYVQDLTGATDAYKKSLQAIIDKSANVAGRVLTHEEIAQAHADLHRDAIAVALKIDGSNRVNERVMRMADEMSGARSVEDLMRILPGRGGDVDAAMRGATQSIDRTVNARIAALNGIPVEHVGEGRYRFVGEGAFPAGQPAGGAAPTRVKANFDAEAKK